MFTGNLQRRWSESRPAVFDKETRIVCLDITEETRIDENNEEKSGYSYIQVEIDHQIDYGHIKSQLIEAGFAQKDEFGLVMNAIESIVSCVSTATSWAKFKESLSTEDIEIFVEFCTFRQMCANAAHEVMNHYV